MKTSRSNASYRLATITVDMFQQSHLSVPYREKRILELLASALDSEPDLVILPELCWLYGTPWKKWRDHAESRDSRRMRLLGRLARKHRCYLAAPSLEQRKDGVFNTLVLFDRSGRDVWHYDKVALTKPELELQISPGRRVAPCETDFGRVGASICFDLNFHELAEAWGREKTDLIMFSSMFRGGHLLPLWSMLSDAYVAAATGDEGARVVNPLGRSLARSSQYSPVVTCDLPRDFEVFHIDGHSEKWARLRSKYGGLIDLEIASEEGRFIMSRRSGGPKVASLVHEFGMTPLREYMVNARQRNRGSLETACETPNP